MSDMTDTTTTEPSSESNINRRRSVRLPGSRGVQVSIGVSILLLLAGLLLFDGPMAGVLGLWGLSLLAATIVGVVAYRIWYRYGS
ncbi:hypothetical protein JMJ58_22795 (plasmid) [Haloterrigena salifodinae]|uniref:Uncharacterized protein n=2 Tax=Haloterrigena salifodinae TaxID=2675099 RepID=A0A8T8E7F4_9EURY|nr:hypothetical protein JMJ58_22795 [Haloterrigena salifodinae]